MSSTSRSGRPTLRDVAARARVSAMTITRVLRDDARVLPETRARVLAAVAELGYRPNAAARDLRLGRAGGLVGLAVTDLAGRCSARLARGVDSVVAGHGLRAVTGATGRDLPGERELIADLVARRVDGIIAVPAGDDQSHLATAAARGMPVVCAGRPPSGFEADHVLVDDFGGAREATGRLLDLGHRRIGFLGPPAGGYAGAERLRGHRATLAAAGVAAPGEYERQGLRDAGEAARAAAALLALPAPPTALLCAGHRTTIGALRAVAAAGTDTALAGFADIEVADLLGRPLLLVAHDSGETGRAAGRLLLDRIHRTPGAPRRTTIPTQARQYGIPRPVADA